MMKVLFKPTKTNQLSGALGYGGNEAKNKGSRIMVSDFIDEKNGHLMFN